MLFDVVLERYCERTPFAVMLRASLEHLFSPARLDELFERAAVGQYTRRLTFSALTALLTEVVLRVRPSVRKAYHSAAVPAGIRSVYDKLAGVEPCTCEALVQQSARDAATVLSAWPGARRPDPIPGLRLRTVDGNFLAGTHHRLRPLRGCGAAALPGMSVVVRDDRTGLLTHALLREDAYTNERSLSGPLLAWLDADDLLLADRNYCTAELLGGVPARRAFFLVRHHKGLHLHALGPRRRAGTTGTGAVYEQRVRLGEKPGGLVCRCVVVALNRPTRDGDTEVVLLSNVPAGRARAAVLADLYLRRWRLETSFQELTVLLRCEVNTLAYPKAALFGFALAVAAYNVFAVLQGAVASVRGRGRAEEELSLHAVVEEVSSVKRGMEAGLPEEVWERFARMSGQAFAGWLRGMAERIDWSRYKKSKRAAKKPVAVKKTQRGAHRSTARVLLNRPKK
jgi:hypothetical protein